MDFVLLLLLLYIALCCKPCLHGDLSSGGLLPLRGICAVGIIFRHVTQNIPCDDTLIFKYFDLTGNLFVAVFFMVSGNALSAQYEAKGKLYLHGFLKKRLTALLLPYFVFFLMYWLLNLSLRQFYPEGRVLESSSGTVLYSWYVKTIAFLYVLYYLAQRLSRGAPLGFWGILGLGLTCYVLVCRSLDYGIWWYNTILAFPFGMLYYRLHRSGKNKNPWIVLGASCLVLGAALVLRLKVFTDGNLGLMMDGLTSLAFPLIFFSFLRKFSLRSPVLNYLGSRSYEIYLAQGIPFTLLYSGFLEITSPLIFCVIAMAGSLLIAEAVYRLDRRLLKLISEKKGLLQNENTGHKSKEKM